MILYVHVTLFTFEGETTKQAKCRIGEKHLGQVYSYPESQSDEDILVAVAAKLTEDGYLFDSSVLE
jgi:hypothetical protein